MILSGAGRGRRRGAGEEGERDPGRSVQGERPALSVRVRESERGDRDSLRERGGFRKTMRRGSGGEGGGDQVWNLSRGKRKESPLGGRGWGEAQKKCTLEILEISVKKGERRRVLWGRGA